MSEESAKANLVAEKFILKFSLNSRNKLAQQKRAKSKVSPIVYYPAPLAKSD